jgi:hypothetical protein
VELFVQMGESDLFWNLSISDLKQGFVEDDNSLICLLCNESIEKGIIYTHDNVLYEARKYMTIHIKVNHQSVFNSLIKLDKKFTGLTDHQKQILNLFYQGKSDQEIQTLLGIGSKSTIRNHRFVLNEKERQAKIFITLMELLKEQDKYAPNIIQPHKSARMIDDRYNITQNEAESLINTYFPSGIEGQLSRFPIKEKHKLVVLRVIANKLKTDHLYTESEINNEISYIYSDYVTVRRYLIEYGFIDRKPDGSQYWLLN